MLNPRKDLQRWLPDTLFGMVGPEVVSTLVDLGTPRAFRSGERLLAQGEDSSHVVLILAGIVKVTALTGNGRTVLLAIRVAGDAVGELAATDREPRTATV